MQAINSNAVSVSYQFIQRKERESKKKQTAWIERVTYLYMFGPVCQTYAYSYTFSLHCPLNVCMRLLIPFDAQHYGDRPERGYYFRFFALPMCHHKLYLLWMTIILIDDLLVAIFRISRSLHFSAAAVRCIPSCLRCFTVYLFASLKYSLENWNVQSIIIHFINAGRSALVCFCWFFFRNGKQKKMMLTKDDVCKSN